MTDTPLPTYEETLAQFTKAIGSTFSVSREDHSVVTVTLKSVEESDKNPDRTDMKTFVACFLGPKHDQPAPLNGHFENGVTGSRLLLLTPSHNDAEHIHYHAVFNMKTKNHA